MVNHHWMLKSTMRHTNLKCRILLTYKMQWTHWKEAISTHMFTKKVKCLLLFLISAKIDEEFWHVVLKIIYMECSFESYHTAESSTCNVRTLAITTDTVKFIWVELLYNHLNWILNTINVRGSFEMPTDLRTRFQEHRIGQSCYPISKWCYIKTYI